MKQRRRKCYICHQWGALERRRTQVYGREDDLLIIQGVPVISCPNCGSITYRAASIHRIEAIRRQRATVAREVTVQIADFDDARVQVPPRYAQQFASASRAHQAEHTAPTSGDAGMTTAARRGKTHIDPHIEIAVVRTDDKMLWITLTDGRVIGAPLAWFPRLADATPEQRQHWKLWPAKTAIHWPDIDEDISARVLMGHPS